MKQPTRLFIFLFIFLLGGISWYAYRSTIAVCLALRPLVSSSFSQSIDADLNKRFLDINDLYIVSTPPNYKPHGTVKITTEEGTTIVKRDSSEPHNPWEEEKKSKQTVLADTNAIVPTTLDSFFCQELLKKNIPAKTAVIVNDGKTNKNARSSTDTSIYNSPLKAGPFKLGLFKEIEVTGYAIVPWWYIAAQVMQQPPVIILLSAILLTTGVWLIIRKRLHLKTLPINALGSGTDGIFHFGQLSLDTHTQTVFAGNHPIKVTERDYQLLLLFMSSSHHYVSREKIVQHFWSEKEDCTDRINTSISRLRKILKETDPSLKISTEKKAGYRLLIQDNDTSI